MIEINDTTIKNWYQNVVKFPNGYAASIISKHGGSYGGNEGLFEVAVMDHDGVILYDTPVTIDVVGWCDFADVAALLDQIMNLPSKVSA